MLYPCASLCGVVLLLLCYLLIHVTCCWVGQPPNLHWWAEAASIGAVNVKIPPFWPTNPQVWFSQVEAQFTTQGITQQGTKNDYILASLAIPHQRLHMVNPTSATTHQQPHIGDLTWATQHQRPHIDDPTLATPHRQPHIGDPTLGDRPHISNPHRWQHISDHTLVTPHGRPHISEAQLQEMMKECDLAQVGQWGWWPRSNNNLELSRCRPPGVGTASTNSNHTTRYKPTTSSSSTAGSQCGTICTEIFNMGSQSFLR